MMPLTTYAASKPTFFGPIVPEECKCTGQKDPASGNPITTAPDFGCVLQVAQNSVNFAITFASLLFTIYIVIAAIQFITRGDNSEDRSKARTRLTNVVVGLAVMLTAWLVVDYVMKSIYDETGFFGPWNSILGGKSDNSDRCIVATKPQALFAGTVDIMTTSNAPGDGGGGSAVTAGGSGTSKLNIDTAVSSAMSNRSEKSQGRCAAYVEKALAAGGVTGVSGNGNSIGPSLLAHGFTKVGTGTVGSPITGLQRGDVVSISAGPSDTCSANHKTYGHTEIWTGSGWVSDYYASDPNATSMGLGSCAVGDSVTVYRP